jgi:hypothetical protein
LQLSSDQQTLFSFAALVFSKCSGTLQPFGTSPFRVWGKQIMKLSSSFAASSAVAILSTALLSGPAVSQIGTGRASSLPSVTVDAPRQVARPHATNQSANTGVTRRTTGSSTAQTRSGAPNTVFGPNTVLGRVAKLEKAASSCNDGCETSYRVGNAPWVGCSVGGESYGIGPFSVTCRDTLTYKTYAECTDTKAFLGGTQKENRWLCSSLQAGNKLTQEKVAAFKPSGR